MFGEGFMYTAEDQKEFLAEGDYEATISNVMDNAQLQNAINVFFNIKGHPNCNPYTMTLFARPVLGQLKGNGQTVTEEDCKKWDKTMSRFFDAFGIKAGDFNFPHWKGHSGWLTCKKNKTNEYSSLWVAFNQHKDEKAPEPVQKVAAAVGGTVAPAPASATSDYQEDIPF